MKYSKVIQKHLYFALQIYPPKKLEALQKESGITFWKEGKNTGKTAHDVHKYLQAIRNICGETSYVSAKMVCTNAAREYNLSLKL